MFTKLLTIFIILGKYIWTAARMSLEKILNSDGSKGIYM
jgi:hypothetical protein